ncbi:MAG: hypothetical protein HC799_17440 [Limnothrix sp. RL_2_0]|nr:hypothetical protein [Limnothrix sp. RL_2_0]
MINALILATVTAAAIYFIAGFFHHCTASICARHRAAISQTVSEVVEAIATSPAIELPDSIRGLRDFVRENGLQSAIKGITGKSVSSLKKAELIEAVMMAIA